LCNSILGKEIFLAKPSQSSVTRECQIERRIETDMSLLILDTPGFFSTNQTHHSSETEIARSIQLTDPGPHIFLIVLTFSRMTDEEKQTIQRIREVFRGDILRHSIVVFTGLDGLTKQNMTPKEFIEQRDPNNSEEETFLQVLIRECENRYFAIDNLDTGEKKGSVVTKLISQIKDLVKANDNKPFFNLSTVTASGKSSSGLRGNMHIMGSFKLTNPVSSNNPPLQPTTVSTTKQDAYVSS
jgi:hypothetical protein